MKKGIIWSAPHLVGQAQSACQPDWGYPAEQCEITALKYGLPLRFYSSQL